MLAALADRADEDGYCYPSNEWISHKCAPMPVETVRRVVRELAEQGLLAKEERRRRADGTLGTWLLRLQLPASVHECTVVQRAPATAPPFTSARAEPSIEPLALEPNGSRARDLIWDTLVELFGAEAEGTERGRWNAARKSLKAQKATPEQLRHAAAVYRTHPTFKDCAMTPTALTANWTLLTANGKTPQELRADDLRARIAAQEGAA